MNFAKRSLKDRLAGKCLFIGTPCFGAQVFLNFHAALVDTVLYLRDHGVPFVYPPCGGDSLVQRARNVMVGKFLQSPATHLLFIDADIGWKPQDVLKLLAGDKDICGAVYPKKCYPIEWPANPFHNEGELEVDDDTKWLRWRDMPTGFLMISRKCIEDMVSRHPEWKCVFDPGTGQPEPFSYSLFDCFTDADGTYLSEDFGFCRRAQKDGYKVWCDPTISLSHFGGHMFQAGCLADTMFQQAEESIEGWMSPDELRWLKAAAARMDSVVEIGSWKGRSTHALASACKGPVYAVDTWQGSPEDLVGPNAPHAEAVYGDIFSQFMDNLKDCQNVEPIRGESSRVAATFGPQIGACRDEDRPAFVDMVFIDGSHEYEAVKADIEAWGSKAQRLICGHDWDRPGVQRAVKEAFGHRATLAAGSIWQVWL